MARAVEPKRKLLSVIETDLELDGFRLAQFAFDHYLQTIFIGRQGQKTLIISVHPNRMNLQHRIPEGDAITDEFFIINFGSSQVLRNDLA